jgi:hypothetical protein
MIQLPESSQYPATGGLSPPTSDCPESLTWSSGGQDREVFGSPNGSADLATKPAPRLPGGDHLVPSPWGRGGRCKATKPDTERHYRLPVGSVYDVGGGGLVEGWRFVGCGWVRLGRERCKRRLAELTIGAAWAIDVGRYQSVSPSLLSPPSVPYWLNCRCREKHLARPSSDCLSRIDDCEAAPSRHLLGEKGSGRVPSARSNPNWF